MLSPIPNVEVAAARQPALRVTSSPSGGGGWVWRRGRQVSQLLSTSRMTRPRFDSEEARCVPPLAFAFLAVLLLQPHLLAEERDDEHQGEQRPGDPYEPRSRDDARAKKEHVVSKVLRVAREPVGAGGRKAVPLSRAALPAGCHDPPDRPQSSQQRQGVTACC